MMPVHDPPHGAPRFSPLRQRTGAGGRHTFAAHVEALSDSGTAQTSEWEVE